MKNLVGILLLICPLLTSGQITITKKQAEWCLENRDKIFNLQRRIEVNDSIQVQDSIAIDELLLKIKALYTIIENDSTIKSNDKIIIEDYKKTNNTLEKLLKRNKFWFDVLKGTVVGEFAVILSLLLILLI
jgi:hypothetical protein